MLKPIVKVIEVPLEAERAYHLFTEEMGQWWPLEGRSISFHTIGKAAKTLDCDVTAGGAIVEVGADDTRYVWGNFVDCDPPHSVAIDFHMGQPKEQITHIIVSFIPLQAAQTMVKLVHSGWESYGELAHMMREGYDTGWDEIFVTAFGDKCRKGQRPIRPHI